MASENPALSCGIDDVVASSVLYVFDFIVVTKDLQLERRSRRKERLQGLSSKSW